MRHESLYIQIDSLNSEIGVERLGKRVDLQPGKQLKLECQHYEILLGVPVSLVVNTSS